MLKKALPNVDENGLMTGNKDEKEEIKFPVGWAGMVVVTQFNVFNSPSGKPMIDEGTRRTMPYEPAVFDKLVETQGFNDLQYRILHDPR